MFDMVINCNGSITGAAVLEILGFLVRLSNCEVQLVVSASIEIFVRVRNY